MEYILMLLAISFTVLNSSFLHKFANKGLNNTGDKLLFNGGVSAVWAVLLFALAILTDSLVINSSTVFYALIYAVILCAYQFFKTMSLSCGPVSITTLIANCAFLITTAYAFFFERQPVSSFQFIGLCVLVFALVLCLNQNSGNGARMSMSWGIYTLIFFFAGGGLGIFYRFFGKSGVSDNVTSMMFLASAMAALIYTILGIGINKIQSKPFPRLTGYAMQFVLLCGLTGCVYNRLNISLANVIPSIVFFPISNGGAVIGVTVVGYLAFKEKLSMKQLAGVAVGLLSIIIIGCF